MVLRRTAIGAPLGGLLLAVPGAAQTTGTQAAPSVAVGAGLSLASPLLLDGNGTAVRLGLAPFVEARLAPAALRRGRLTLGGGARVGAGAVRLRTPDARWSGGTAWQGDVTLDAAVQAGARVLVRGGVGATWLRGPADVAPFDRLRAPRAAAELGVTVRPWARRVALQVAVQAFRVRPAGGAAGGVGRALVGAAYAP